MHGDPPEDLTGGCPTRANIGLAVAIQVSSKPGYRDVAAERRTYLQAIRRAVQVVVNVSSVHLSCTAPLGRSP